MSTNKTASKITNDALVGAKIKLTDGSFTHVKAANKNGYSLACGGTQIPAKRVVARARFLQVIETAPKADEYCMVDGVAHIYTRKDLRALADDENFTVPMPDFSKISFDADLRIVPKVESASDVGSEEKQTVTAHTTLPASLRRLIQKGVLTLNAQQCKKLIEVLGIDYDALPDDIKAELRSLTVITSGKMEEWSAAIRKAIGNSQHVPKDNGGRKHVPTAKGDDLIYLSDTHMDEMEAAGGGLTEVVPKTTSKKALVKSVRLALAKRLKVRVGQLKRGLLLNYDVVGKGHTVALLGIDSMSINCVDIDTRKIIQLPIVRKALALKSIEYLSRANDSELDDEAEA